MDQHVHIASPRALAGTFAALVVLTAITVAVARVDLGQLNIVLALGVACTKAALVALFFMHLKYEHHFLAVILVTATLFVVILAGFVAFDSAQYQPAIRAHREAALQKK